MDCLPFRQGRCENTQTTTGDGATAQETPDLTVTSPSPAQTQRLAEDAAVPTVRSLPPAPGLDFVWGQGEVSPKEFVRNVRAAYSESVHWRRNIFSVPSGKSGKEFVRELAGLFKAYANGSALESIALTAAMLLPRLLLQRPHQTSKSKEHMQCLERRLASWRAGDIDTLLTEGRTIQGRLLRNKLSNKFHEDKVARSFARLMFQGKTKAALRLINEQEKGDLLHLDNVIGHESSTNAPFTVREALLSKHPDGRPASPDALVSGDMEPPTIHPILFESINAAVRKNAALHTDGSIYVLHWQLFLSILIASQQICLWIW